MIQLMYRYPHSLWHEVERQFLLGLRAKDPEMRMRFFSLLFIMNLLRKHCSQDWEALSDVFWLKQGLDLHLAILVEDKPITLAPNSARLRPVVVSGSLPDSSGMQPMVTDIPESSDEAPLTFDSLVSKHAQFLNEMSRLQVMRSLLNSFSALAGILLLL